jgi:hypothetical protein
VIMRLGRCLCGIRLIEHFSPSNTFIPCEQLRASQRDEPLGYPEVTDQTLERIRRRLRPALDAHEASV